MTDPQTQLDKSRQAPLAPETGDEGRVDDKTGKLTKVKPEAQDNLGKSRRGG